jgi:phage terminase small subunit
MATGGTKKAQIRYELFAKEYVLDLNGTRAAIAAGYSEKGADVASIRMLGNARVKELIAGLVEKRVKALDLSADKVLEELARLGFSNMLDYITIQNGAAVVDFSRVTRDQGAAMHEITVDEYMDGSGPDARPVKRIRFKLTDKVRSLELLGRYLKLFQEGENVTQGIKVVIINRAFRPKREPMKNVTPELKP